TLDAERADDTPAVTTTPRPEGVASVRRHTPGSREAGPVARSSPRPRTPAAMTTHDHDAATTDADHVAAPLLRLQDDPVHEDDRRRLPGGERPPLPGPFIVPASVVETRFGGLFYLMHLVLELGVAEALWTVAAPEGEILAAMAAGLLGEAAADDVA